MLGYGHPLALGRTSSRKRGRSDATRWSSSPTGSGRIASAATRDHRQAHPHRRQAAHSRRRARRRAGRSSAEQDLAAAAPSPRSSSRADSGAADCHGPPEGRASTLPQANASMRALSAALEQRAPTPRPGWTVSVEPFRNNFVRDRRSAASGCCWARSASCCSSPAPTSPTCSSRAAPRGSASWPSARRSARPAAAIARQLLVESLVAGAGRRRRSARPWPASSSTRSSR